MSWFEALILGIVQGLAEFFPISSSAHFRIVRDFLHLPQNDLYFELCCNFGTIVAAIYFLRKQIKILTFYSHKKIFMIMLAIVPLFPAYFIYHFCKEKMADIRYLGFFMIASGALLLFTSHKSFKPKKSSPMKDALYIGMMQALALIPGFSRSAATIGGACMRGWDIQEAISFSFLLAIPTILGGQFLETLKILFLPSMASASEPLTSYLIGFISSLGVGLFSIRYLFTITDKKRVRPFGWYCLIIGSMAVVLYYR